MKERLVYSFKYFSKDALAGTVTGVMAVPLTVGICLMSDYPVMTGLYTVIFAAIVGFITFLFKPGNYVGTPGVAAGLAPALALGVSHFGHENMPFVIMITAVFQMVVWKFRFERYILKLVPHYLVEGLLAGVGLKIGLKFLPFMYGIENETEQWFNLARGNVMVLSAVSFIMFVFLFKFYKKKMPALPYFMIMATSIGLSFFIDLHKVSIETVPFQLAWPLPHFEGMVGGEIGFMLLKMVGFAFMLGTIDVIEQVMSNVAIEKLDPEKRVCDSNNSLLAIWIANFGATFFGGMTNLDGLAKSTTNAVAGARTKLSNLFTAAVLLIVVFFPEVLNLMPAYGLGIIMVYSGWKMIANLTHARTEGRYALIMAAICGLLVFQLGIFEGLLIVLSVHGIVQITFMKRLGKSTREIWNRFKRFVLSEKVSQKIVREDLLQEPSIPVLKKWVMAVNAHDLDAVLEIYSKKGLLLSTFSQKPRKNKKEIGKFYKDIFFRMPGLYVEVLDVEVQSVGHVRIDSGHLKLMWESQGFEEFSILRFSMVLEANLIMAHHSSLDPYEEIAGNEEEFDFVM